MDAINFNDEISLLQGLRNKDIRAFSQLYREYSEDLLLLAYTIVHDPVISNQVVDKLFTELWESRPFEHVTPPIHHFLYRELKNNCRTFKA